MAVTPPLHLEHDWAHTMRELLLARADDDTIALLHEEESWTWRDLVQQSAARANVLRRRMDHDRPLHVGVLMDNGPEFVFQLGAAMLGGYVLAGLNPTRRGSSLERDIAFTQCQVVLTDRGHGGLLEGLDLGGVEILDVEDDDVQAWLTDGGDAAPEVVVDSTDVLLLVFTSGTTGEPKAVVCTTGRLADVAIGLELLYGFRDDDVLYISMPMFHSGALMAGVAPSIRAGTAMAVARRFSASGFIPDVRRYGATLAHYVGKPLSYVLAQPERDDDRDHRLRLVFGNEAAPAVIERFAERFGCRVRDAYASSELGIRITRPPETPPGALGRPIGDVRVLNPDTGRPCPVAEYDEDGRLANASEAIGEFVNVQGVGSFEGYWDNPEAAAERVRNGRFHSGDLGYVDADGWLWFAGRGPDWLRVDGENFGAAQVATVANEHPDVVDAVAIGVPDLSAGDQVMLAIQVTDPDGFDGADFARWWVDNPDASPKWIPRYVRVMDQLPLGPSNKVLVRELATHPFDHLDQLWWAPDRGDAYRPFTERDRHEVLAAIEDSGRGHVLAAHP